MYEKRLVHPLPELELPAAEAVFRQAPVLRTHARALTQFILTVRPMLRAELEPVIRTLPEPSPASAYRLAAVDSASRVRSTAALTVLMAVAFKTSATRSEAAEAIIEQLDESYELEAISRVVRGQLEGELLATEALGGDQLVILDNSFLSLAEDAARAELARHRADTPLARDVLERYCRLHLGPEGSLLKVLSNANVVALPKVAEAQALVRELFGRIDLPLEVRRGTAARAMRDRVLLRAVLRAGEYLEPRDLHHGRVHHAHRDRFFHGADFPDRERLLDLYGIGRPDDPRYGIDVVYFRPRRPAGVVAGPVLRIELNRQLARTPEVLERVLGTIELAGDGEHPEPVPQLLADHLAKSSVAHVLDALFEGSLIDLVEEFSDAGDESPTALDVIRWLHEEARS